jgi:hypothetical protein
MKPKYKTAGFWGALVLTVVGVFTGAGAVTNSVVAQVLGVGVTMLTAVGYTAWRLQVKQGTGGKKWYKRTETWLTLAAVAVTALMASGAFGPEHAVSRAASAIAAILSAMGYKAAHDAEAAKSQPSA